MYDLTPGYEQFCVDCQLQLTIAKNGDEPTHDCADELNCPQSAEIRYAEAVRLRNAELVKLSYGEPNTYTALRALVDSLLDARCAEQNARLGGIPTPDDETVNMRVHDERDEPKEEAE